jgi:hypothetical protein
MNTQTTTTFKRFRVSFRALTASGSVQRSTQWYGSLQEIPTKYMKTVGLKYNSSEPCLCFDGKIIFR